MENVGCNDCMDMERDWVKGPEGEFCCVGLKGGYWPEFNKHDWPTKCDPGPNPAAFLHAGAGTGTVLGAAIAAFAGAHLLLLLFSSSSSVSTCPATSHLLILLLLSQNIFYNKKC